MCSYILMRRLANAHPTLSATDLIDLVPATVSPVEISNIGRGYLRSENELPDEITKMFKISGADGFNFHQTHFRRDVFFREWVLQPNYLDLDASYMHPHLQADYVK